MQIAVEEHKEDNPFVTNAQECVQNEIGNVKSAVRFETNV